MIKRKLELDEIWYTIHYFQKYKIRIPHDNHREVLEQLRAEKTFYDEITIERIVH